MYKTLNRFPITLLVATIVLGACGSGGGAGDTDSSAPGDEPTPTTPQGPYTGAAVTLPGTIEAENFDLGGEGVAYHDEDAGNSGGAYRLHEAVDISNTQDSAGGDFDVRSFENGEWLTYSVDITAGADYLVELRVAATGNDASFNLQLDGEDLTGSVPVPNTGSTDTYEWVGRANVTLDAGAHVLAVQSERNTFSLNSIRVSSMPAAGPYLGSPFVVPGSFEAEDFDIGGEGAAYHDTTPGNSGGQYRNSVDVDIAATADTNGGGHDVVEFVAGEWLTWSIDVAEAGDYDVDLRLAGTEVPADFRVLVDGQDLSGAVTVPTSADTTSYTWVGPGGIALPTGAHELTIAADSGTLRLNAVRLQLAAPPEPSPPAGDSREPYRGTPFTVPGTFEAEDFDLGGQDVAYHDNVAGNSGGAYRAAEDVDIAATQDAAGGNYDVNNIETGEWLSYSIDVAQAGDYDVEFRVSSAFADASLHLEVDDQVVGEPIPVPNTGGWGAFTWVVGRDVALSTGQHVLKVVADQQYFNLNSIRISDEAPAPTPPAGEANLIFSSGYEGAIDILAPLDCWGTGCWQDIVGLDLLTNFSWPASIGGGGGRFLMLTDPVTITPLTIGSYMFNRIDSVSGPRGSSSKVLYQEISRNANGTEPMGSSPAQNEFQMLPESGASELYLSFWMKLQPDLVEKMTNLPDGPGIANGGTWRALFAFKTGSRKANGGPADDGDYRVEAYVMTYGNSQPYWAILGDNNAGGGAPKVNSWSLENRQVPVPVGEWFKFEIYWNRSEGDDGRVWMAVDGQVIADRWGPNMGAWNMPINRIIAPMLYSGGRMPVYQWIDDVEVWDGFPEEGDNPPYAPH